jgi:cyclic pyranopterin phosphate synthase
MREVAGIPSEAGPGPLSHLGPEGVRMVDVSGKTPTRRRAVAEGRLTMRPETVSLLVQGRGPKGEAFVTAQVAGIQAAKRTWEWIPLAHPLALSHVSVRLEPEPEAVRLVAEVESVGPTGVEMEALTAVAAAALTLYDMAKAVDRGMTLTEVRLLEKSGGRSGTWRR